MVTPFKTLLFDLDETLMEEWNSAKYCIINTFSRLNTGTDPETFVDILIEEARILWHATPVYPFCRSVGISSWEALWADFDGANENFEYLRGYGKEYRTRAWLNALHRTGNTDLSAARELSEYFKKYRNTRHILFQDALPCLQKYKSRFKFGLVTNGAPDIQQKKIKGGNLAHWFDKVIISGDYGKGKPDPEIFLELVDRLGSNSGNTLMIGDSLQTDIAGSKKAGIMNIWLNRNGKPNDIPDLSPGHEIRNLLELDGVLENSYNC